MKIKNFLAMMMMALCVVACSSDDDGPSPAQTVAGSYTGYAIAENNYFNGNLTQNETVTITANEDGTATVVYTSGTWGTTTISAATVTATTNGFSISGIGSSAITSHSTGATSSYDCEFTGTISANKSDVEIIFDVDVMQGTTITFLKGDAPDNLVVAGSYDSYSVGVHNFGSSVFNNESITLKANTENGTVDLAYSGGWGEATATGLTLSKSNGSYTLSGSGVTVVSGHGATGTSSNYEFTVEATISEDKTTASFVFKINMGAMGNPVTVTTHLGDAPAAMMIAGSYSGYTTAVFAYSPNPMIADDETVKISANEDGTINVAYTSLIWGETNVANISVEEIDGVYTFSGDGTSVMSMNGAPEVTKDCKLTGTINTDKSDLEFIFVIDVMGGTTITFNNGDAPTE